MCYEYLDANNLPIIIIGVKMPFISTNHTTHRH